MTPRPVERDDDFRPVESLFQRGGTVLSKDSFQGIDDFEVVAYLIVLGDAR